MTPINITQWNAHSLPAHQAELERYLEEQTPSPQVICVQETWLNKNKSFALKGYDVERRDRQNRQGGGVAIFICQELEWNPLNVVTSMECMAVQIIARPAPITICNIYSAEQLTEEKTLEEILNQLPQPVLFCGDFNGHHPMWGGRRIDRKGEIIANFIEQNNLVLINDGSGTRIGDRGSLTPIDLSFTTADIARKTKWKVDYSSSIGSDHFPITISISGRALAKSPPALQKWNLERGDWEKFKRLAESEINSSLICKDIDRFAEKVTKAIIKCAEKSIPRKKTRKSKPAAPWWTEECGTKKRLREEALKKVILSRNPDDYESYSKAKNACTAQARKSQTSHWRDYCSGINKNITSKELWQKVKVMKKENKAQGVSTLIDRGGKLISLPEEKANILGEQYSNASSDLNLSDTFLSHRAKFEKENEDTIIGNEDDQSPVNEEFSMDELQAALREAKDTTPGQDDITVSMMRNLPPTALLILLELFNASWRNQHLPSSWKHAIVVPVLKPLKVPNAASSYRPVALTSCVCKIMERMINLRLTWVLESRNLLSPLQSGFRKKRGTIDNIARLENSIQKSLNNGKFTIAVMLDLEKAYDLIWRKGLIYKMRKMGIHGRMIGWARAFLSERTFQVRIQSKLSQIFVLENGTPQGSVISPTFFTIMVNDLPEVFNSALAGLYADDSAIWKSHKNLKHLKGKLEADISAAVNWYRTWGFKVSGGKTEAAIFSRRPVPDNFSLIIDGECVKVKRTVKMLGVIFDSRLTWKDHIEKISARCDGAINLLRLLCGTRWGAHQKQLLQIYYALIRSKLDYGAEVIGSASEKQKKKLQRVQATALRICLGAPRTTPTEAVLTEAGETPLNIRQEMLAAKYMFKCRQLANEAMINKETEPTWHENTTTSYVSRTSRFSQSAGVDPKSIARLKVTHQPPWSKRDHHPLTINQMLTNQEYIKIFTDGAVGNDGRAAAAFVIPELNVVSRHRVANNTSPTTCELVSISLAMKWIEASVFKGLVEITTDSREALNAICSTTNFFEPTLVRCIQRSKSKAEENGTAVVFTWVKSHSGNVGNEWADREAKSALSNKEESISTWKTLQEAVTAVESYGRRKWQERWNNASKGSSFYRSHTPNINERPKIWGSTRKEQVLLTRVRCDQLRLNQNLFKQGKHPTGQCDFCEYGEDVLHVLLHCPRYLDEREAMKAAVSPATLSLGVLCTSEVGNNAVITFLKDTGIIDRLRFT